MKSVRIFAQHDIELVTARRRQDFAFVMFAHRRDAISANNSTFQKIHAAEELEAMQGEKALRQIREREIQSPETPLLRNVMNR